MPASRAVTSAAATQTSAAMHMMCGMVMKALGQNASQEPLQNLKVFSRGRSEPQFEFLTPPPNHSHMAQNRVSPLLALTSQTSLQFPEINTPPEAVTPPQGPPAQSQALGTVGSLAETTPVKQPETLAEFVETMRAQVHKAVTPANRTRGRDVRPTIRKKPAASRPKVAHTGPGCSKCRHSKRGCAQCR